MYQIPTHRYTQGSHQGKEELYEEVEQDEGYTSLDDMDGLSDSQSTFPSHSRPTTPYDRHPSPNPNTNPTSNQNPNNDLQKRSTTSPESDSDSFSQSQTPSNPAPKYLILGNKASNILGLIPGTLPHAKACLEHARVEARKLVDISPAKMTIWSSTSGESSGVSSGSSWLDMSDSYSNQGGNKGRLDRARKAMSIIGGSTTSNLNSKIQNHHYRAVKGDNSGGGGGVPSVILSQGGKEEELKREKRRKVVDGVLCWQGEVSRLEIESHTQRQEIEVELNKKGMKGGRSRGINSGFR